MVRTFRKPALLIGVMAILLIGCTPHRVYKGIEADKSEIAIIKGFYDSTHQVRPKDALVLPLLLLLTPSPHHVWIKRVDQYSLPTHRFFAHLYAEESIYARSGEHWVVTQDECLTGGRYCLFKLNVQAGRTYIPAVINCPKICSSSYPESDLSKGTVKVFVYSESQGVWEKLWRKPERTLTISSYCAKRPLCRNASECEQGEWCVREGARPYGLCFAEGPQTSIKE